VPTTLRQGGPGTAGNNHTTPEGARYMTPELPVRTFNTGKKKGSKVNSSSSRAQSYTNMSAALDTLFYSWKQSQTLHLRHQSGLRYCTLGWGWSRNACCAQAFHAPHQPPEKRGINREITSVSTSEREAMVRVRHNTPKGRQSRAKGRCTVYRPQSFPLDSQLRAF
jgi:hypothetical protein